MTYIQYSISEIQKLFDAYKENKEKVEDALEFNDGQKQGEPLKEIPIALDPFVLRIETCSGDQRPRTLRVLEIGDDYIIARGRNQLESEVFNFNQVASWRLVKFQKDDWKW
jgi:hypothetical protein